DFLNFGTAIFFYPPRALLGLLLAASHATVAALELLDATCGVHDALCAGPERVGLAGDVDDDQRVLVAILPLDRTVGSGGGAGKELFTGSRILEYHWVVIRVDILLHTSSLRDRKSTRLNSSPVSIAYAVFCWKEKRQRT